MPIGSFANQRGLLRRRVFLTFFNFWDAKNYFVQ